MRDDFKKSDRKSFSKISIIILSVAVVAAGILGFNLLKQERAKRVKLYLEKAAEFSLAGDIAPAIENYKKALQLLPDSESYLNLGNLYSRAKQYGQAVKAYEAALELEGESVEVYNRLGEAYSNLGMTYGLSGHGQEAIKNLERAVSIKPNFPQAYNNLGIEYVKLEEYSKAEEYFKQALELDPNFSDAYVNLLITYRRGGKEEEAAGLTDKIQEIVQENPERYR